MSSSARVVLLPLEERLAAASTRRQHIVVVIVGAADWDGREHLPRRRRAIAYDQKLPSSRPEPSAARRSGGTYSSWPRRQEEVPRLRRPPRLRSGQAGGFARDDG